MAIGVANWYAMDNQVFSIKHEIKFNVAILWFLIAIDSSKLAMCCRSTTV